MKIAFLGLGVMGGPMAGHLATAGLDVVGFNRTNQKAIAWRDKYDAPIAETIMDAVTDRDVVSMCLGDDPDVQSTVDTVLPALKPGAVIVDHTTASPSLAVELAAKAQGMGIHFVDAPVSGGEGGAIAGKLSIMCGGTEEAIAVAKAACEPYTGKFVHIGPSGHGQLCKAVNQICIAGLLQALSEGVHFAEAANLDVEKVLNAISGGAAQSWQMDNRAKTMSERSFDFGFAVDWMRKDLRIALSEARRLGAQLPVAALVDQFYADVQRIGGGRQDTSSLIRRFDRDGR